MTAFDAIVSFCEELGWVHFFQAMFNIVETMSYPFWGTVVAEIFLQMHVQEKENTEWVNWYFAAQPGEGSLRCLSLILTSELTEMLVNVEVWFLIIWILMFCLW